MKQEVSWPLFCILYKNEKLEEILTLKNIYKSRFQIFAKGKLYMQNYAKLCKRVEKHLFYSVMKSCPYLCMHLISVQNKLTKSHQDLGSL